MLVLTINAESRVNFYQNTDARQPRLLGSAVIIRAAHGRARIGFEFAGDVKIVRDEVDGTRARITECEADETGRAG